MNVDEKIFVCLFFCFSLNSTERSTMLYFVKHDYSMSPSVSEIISPVKHSALKSCFIACD